MKKNKVALQKNTEEEQQRRSRRKKRTLLFMIILLLIFFIMITLTVSYYETVLVDVSINTTVPINHSQTTRKEVCKMSDFDYGYHWQGWEVDAQKGLMTPYLELYNLIDKTGVFYVTFAFVRNNTYPWEKYNTSVNMTIPAVRSQEQVITLEGSSYVLVISPTEMPDNEEYWVYAEITPPQFRDCAITETLMTNASYEQEIKIDKMEKTVKRKKTLAAYVWMLLRDALR